jgi:alpha,alpha-trehalose phosphorylase
LLLHFPYFDLYRKQVIKQADLVLALHLCGDSFTADEKARDFAYYEARTVRDSSLSAGTQAVLAAEVGHLQLAYDYFSEVALTDLHDVHNNVRNGLHLASLAGAWLATVAGFGGMRDHGGQLSFAPRIPAALERVAFRLSVLDARFEVEIREHEVTYRALAGGPIKTTHYGEAITIGAEPLTKPIPALPPRPPVIQPIGRAPLSRDPAQVRRNIELQSGLIKPELLRGT